MNLVIFLYAFCSRCRSPLPRLYAQSMRRPTLLSDRSAVYMHMYTYVSRPHAHCILSALNSAYALMCVGCNASDVVVACGHDGAFNPSTLRTVYLTTYRTTVSGMSLFQYRNTRHKHKHTDARLGGHSLPQDTRRTRRVVFIIIARSCMHST